jgi:hypothetical protein
MTSDELDHRLMRIESGLVRIESSLISMLSAVTSPPTMHDTRALAMQIVLGDKTALRTRNKIAKQRHDSNLKRS